MAEARTAVGAARVLEAGPGDGSLAPRRWSRPGSRWCCWSARRACGRSSASASATRSVGRRAGARRRRSRGWSWRNEVLDALPFRLFADGTEVRVGVDDDRPLLRAAGPRRAGAPAHRRPARPTAFVTALAAPLARGRVLSPTTAPTARRRPAAIRCARTSAGRRAASAAGAGVAGPDGRRRRRARAAAAAGLGLVSEHQARRRRLRRCCRRRGAETRRLHAAAGLGRAGRQLASAWHQHAARVSGAWHSNGGSAGAPRPARRRSWNRRGQRRRSDLATALAVRLLRRSGRPAGACPRCSRTRPERAATRQASGRCPPLPGTVHLAARSRRGREGPGDAGPLGVRSCRFRRSGRAYIIPPMPPMSGARRRADVLLGAPRPRSPRW